MNITTENKAGTLTIFVNGKVDTSSAPELEKEIVEKIPGVTQLIFDLKEMSYTSSAGLRVFLKAQKMMAAQGTMKLIHVAEPVMEIFEMTGFCDIMTIEADA